MCQRHLSKSGHLDLHLLVDSIYFNTNKQKHTHGVLKMLEVYRSHHGVGKAGEVSREEMRLSGSRRRGKIWSLERVWDGVMAFLLGV